MTAHKITEANWPEELLRLQTAASRITSMLVGVNPMGLKRILDERETLLARVARADAMVSAHSLGWHYDDDMGCWYEDNGRGLMVCLDEELVAYFAPKVPS